MLGLAFPYIKSFHTTSLGVVQIGGIQIISSDFSVRILDVCSGITQLTTFSRDVHSGNDL